MLLELLAIGTIGVLGKKAIENPDKAKEVIGDFVGTVKEDAMTARELQGYFEALDNSEIRGIINGSISPYRTEAFYDYECAKKEEDIAAQEAAADAGLECPPSKYKRPSTSVCKTAAKAVAQNRGLY